jgi:hypothetical protein
VFSDNRTPVRDGGHSPHVQDFQTMKVHESPGGGLFMDKRELLEKLRTELGSLEYGRNRRSVHMPWENVSFFHDSVTCLNYGLEGRPHPCQQCMLMPYVPENARAESNPCHHIPLDNQGNTIDSLDRGYNRNSVEDVVAGWLRAKIAEIENDLTAAEVHHQD